jgi:carboxypeptidase C (cathepsin A)
MLSVVSEWLLSLFGHKFICQQQNQKMKSQLLSLTLFLVSFAQHGQVASSALPSASDLLVQGLEKIEPAYGLFEGEMYAGPIPMDNGDRHGNLFFWLYAPDAPTVDDAIIIWLNGGPGCSSVSTGNLYENSPVTMPLNPAGSCCSTKKDPLTYNQYAWTNASAVMYVEQPVQVGFSQGGPLPKDEGDLAGDFYAFYENFLTIFPKYQSYRLFIVGESYGGMYVPSIALRMHQETEKLKQQPQQQENTADDSMQTHSIPIKLGGIALGNGWMDARVQGRVVIDYAYWHGMVDAYTKDALHQEFDLCMAAYDNNVDEKEQSPFHKFTIPDECAVMEAVMQAAGKGAFSGMSGGPNIYDVTTWDSYQSLVANDNTNTLFLNNPKVKKLIHAPMNVSWQGCIPGAGRRRRRQRRQLREKNPPYPPLDDSPAATAAASSTDSDGDSDGDESQLPGALLLKHDQPESTVPYVAALLDAGIPALIYNGDRDLSTCAQGSEMLLNDMDWSGAAGWKTAPRGLWVTNHQQVSGYAKFHQGLGFVVVYNSGHMVPTNQPAAALDLITRFLSNQSFMDYELPSWNIPQQPVSLAKSAQEELHVLALNGGLTSVTLAVFVTALLMAFGAGFLLSSRRSRKKSDYTPIGNA